MLPTRSRRGPAARLHLLQPQRHVWPIVAVGVGVFLASQVVTYGLRAAKRMQEEDESPSVAARENDDQAAATASSNARTASHMSQCLGLDLGTAYSKMAHLDKSTSTVLENREGKRSVACAVAERDGLLTGQLARAARHSKPGKTLTAIPLLLNRVDPVVLDGKTYSAEQLCTAIAREMLSTATSKGVSSCQAILSAPNSFSDNDRGVLIKAVRAAGVDVVEAVPDGITSVLGALSLLGDAKGHELLTRGSGNGGATIAVVDIGGSITQLSLIDVTLDDSVSGGLLLSLVNEVTLPIGGETFDARIVDYCSAEFVQRNIAVPAAASLLSDGLAKQRLFDAAEQSRHDLTSKKVSVINVPFLSATESGPLHLELTLSRAQLDNLLLPPVSEIKASFKKLLFEGGATSPLKAVLLVGGGSRMPFARQLVKDATGGLEALTFSEPEEIAAIGAARYSKFISN